MTYMMIRILIDEYNQAPAFNSKDIYQIYIPTFKIVLKSDVEIIYYLV